MRIVTEKTQDKHVRVSFETWQKLRTAAYSQNKRLKTVLEEVFAGELNPTTFEPIQKELF